LNSRDSKTEKSLILYCLGDKHIKDTKSLVSAVYVYPLDDKTTVNQSKRPLLLNFFTKDGTYLSNKVSANGKIDLG
jgi:hypothetical protein